MALDYNPVSFKQIDLRKYHIKDLQDIVKFCEFLSSRIEEVRQVSRTANNKINTQASLLESYKRQNAKQIAQYGSPVNLDDTEVKVETIKPAEATSVEAEHKELLDELRSVGNDPDERRTVELEVGDDIYRLTAGKNRNMFYKNGRLTKEENVPEDTRDQLLSVIAKPQE